MARKAPIDPDVKSPGVRIIGGRWRGRRLPVPDIEGLRPSGDRLRETLFNWLQHELRGRHALDLFAGTGVLGLEALSRGAAAALLVESSAEACRAIQCSITSLDADNVRLLQRDALMLLAGQPQERFELAFVDPPFGQGMQQRALDLLAANDWLLPGALVYVETGRGEPCVPPVEWKVRKDKTLGAVHMQLLQAD